MRHGSKGPSGLWTALETYDDIYMEVTRAYQQPATTTALWSWCCER